MADQSNEMGMVERVARVIDPIAFADFEGLRDYCLSKGGTMERAMEAATSMHGPRRDRAIAKARAAIEAMREPSGYMMEDGARAYRSTRRPGAGGMSIEAQYLAETAPFRAGWSAALDAALSHDEVKA